MPQAVISASRRTDIPAFYMPWFMDCIHEGHFNVINPYNRRTALVPATPDRVHTIVFWSKNFGPFLAHGHGDTLARLGYHLFFNFTINSPHDRLEPMMPSLRTRLAQLRRLADTFGPACMQWRFDPICFYKDAGGREHTNLDRFTFIAREVAKAGVGVCITSFADLYRKVIRRMTHHPDLEFIDPSLARKVEVLTDLSDQLKALGMALHLCCEQEVLAALPKDLPVKASACIPNERLVQLYGPGISLARDRGQRVSAGCTCGVSKDIGSYALHPCKHNCLYCYANPEADGKL